MTFPMTRIPYLNKIADSGRTGISESELLAFEDCCKELQLIDQEIEGINGQIRVLQEKKQALLRQRKAIKDIEQKQQSAILAAIDWETKEYPWTSQLKELLLNKFGITSLRSQQLPAMNATMSGTHCILVMPTGGGKSLCYQMPALLSKGLTLVVCPLVSLIEDQVMGLEGRGISAAMLSASSPKDHVSEVYQGITDPKWPCRLLYVTPERLAKSKRLMAKLQKAHQMNRISRVAIDEVHCCSQWGHDFRPDYKFLGILAQTFPGVPILGLTATATAHVLDDVQKMLNIKGCLILRASFNRPNLYYEVREKSAASAECVDAVAQLLTERFNGQSGIIYTVTIKETTDLVDGLRAKGVRVAPYHGAMEAAARSKVHQRWIKNEYQAVVATIAFGMGIDKADVRFVIHYSISKSVENYYQESGRAGRDGNRAFCILFWRLPDLFKQSTMVFTEQTGLEKLYAMLAYCIDATRCRRDLLSEHFEERWQSSDCEQMCDHCRRPHHSKKVSLDRCLYQLQLLIDHAESVQQRLTGQKLLDAWLGRGPSNLRVVNATNSKLPRSEAEATVAQLLLDGCLKEDFHFTPYSTISYIVLGPKGEAGLSPSPLVVKGQQRKDMTSTGKIVQDKKNADEKIIAIDVPENSVVGDVKVCLSKDTESEIIAGCEFEIMSTLSNKVRAHAECNPGNSLHDSNLAHSPSSKRRRIITIDSSSDDET